MIKEISFIVGSIIGPGIFLLPFNLYPYGINGLMSLIFCALIFLIIGIYFCKYTSPFKLIEKRLGYNFAFLIGWSYWIISWLGNIIILKQISFYICNIFPVIDNFKIFLELLILILLTALNLLSMQNRLAFELVSSGIKISILLLLPLFFLSLNKYPLQSSLCPSQLMQSIVQIVWCFSGVETVGLFIKSKRPLFISMGIITAIYIINVYSVFSLYGAKSIRPDVYMEIMQIAFGSIGRRVLEVIIILQSLSSLSSWILSSGLWAYDLSEKKLMPTYFLKKNSLGVPQRALLSGSISLGIIILFAQSKYTSEIIISFTNLLCNLLLLFYASFSFSCFLEEKNFSSFLLSLIFLILYIYSQNWFSIGATFIIFLPGLVILFMMRKSIIDK
jgi:APA family basic amino acid/polyamine antiporter